MARSARSHPVRTLLVLVGLIAVLYGAVAAGVHWDKAQWTPKLALDLEGGTEIVLSPQPVAGRRSVDADRGRRVGQHHPAARQRQRRLRGRGGAAGPGADTKIVVSPARQARPGDRQARRAVRPAAVPRGARRRADGGPAAGRHADHGPARAAPPARPARARRPRRAAARRPRARSPRARAVAKPSATGSTSGMNIPRALKAAPTPSPSGAASTSTATAATGSATASATPPAASPDGQAHGRERPELGDPGARRPQFDADSTARTPTRAGSRAHRRPTRTSRSSPAPTTAARSTSSARPSSSAPTSRAPRPAWRPTARASPATDWQVDLNFTGERRGQVRQGDQPAGRPAEPTRRATGSRSCSTTSSISAPATNGGDHRRLRRRSPATSRQASAPDLANQLKFGALPLSFEVQTAEHDHPDAGHGQAPQRPARRRHRPALVVLYSLLQYRALGLVTVASLADRRDRSPTAGRALWAGAGLPARPGRRHRPDRGDRHHRRLVHRVLRTHPRRGARRAGRCAPRSRPAGRAPGARSWPSDARELPRGARAVHPGASATCGASRSPSA